MNCFKPKNNFSEQLGRATRNVYFNIGVYGETRFVGCSFAFLFVLQLPSKCFSRFLLDVLWSSWPNCSVAASIFWKLLKWELYRKPHMQYVLCKADVLIEFIKFVQIMKRHTLSFHLKNFELNWFSSFIAI